jgi:hypothetical protein
MMTSASCEIITLTILACLLRITVPYQDEYRGKPASVTVKMALSIYTSLDT